MGIFEKLQALDRRFIGGDSIAEVFRDSRDFFFQRRYVAVDALAFVRVENYLLKSIYRVRHFTEAFLHRVYLILIRAYFKRQRSAFKLEYSRVHSLAF